VTNTVNRINVQARLLGGIERILQKTLGAARTAREEILSNSVVLHEASPHVLEGRVCPLCLEEFAPEEEACGRPCFKQNQVDGAPVDEVESANRASPEADGASIELEIGEIGRTPPMQVPVARESNGHSLHKDCMVEYLAG